VAAICQGKYSAFSGEVTGWRMAAMRERDRPAETAEIEATDEMIAAGKAIV
jgi:hypothetical protein